MDENGNLIQWHMAFGAAFQIELMDDAENLEFIMEYQLARKPMSVDLMVIKKDAEMDVSKNIGHIFKKHNLVQYKSPEDYLSVRAFYKTYGYACFYLSDAADAILPEEVTLTYVCNRYPRRLFYYLEKRRGMKIRKYDEGIYYVEGDQFAIQILITRELSKEENYWLHSLRNDLRAGGEIKEFIEKYDRNRSSGLHQAVADAVLRANWREVEKEKRMCDALRELFKDDFEEARRKGTETGLREGRCEGLREGLREGRREGLREGRREGLQEGLLKSLIVLVIKKMKKGKAVSLIAEELEEETEVIQRIYDLISENQDECEEKLVELYQNLLACS